MKWRGRKLRKIPRFAPSLPATLSSFGPFYHGYHNYWTRSRSILTYANFLLRTISCIPCVVASDLCAQSSFPLLVAQISACLSTPFLKLYFRMAAHG